MNETETKTSYPNNIELSEKKAGGLWLKESKKGEKYLSLQVEIGGQKYNLTGFTNKFFAEDPARQPKYKLFWSDDTYTSLIKSKSDASETVAVAKPNTPKPVTPKEAESDDIF
jgi:uncharacterized protein (DUF736 family)